MAIRIIILLLIIAFVIYINRSERKRVKKLSRFGRLRDKIKTREFAKIW